MWGRLTEIALLFGRLGATAFGGPAAHIALMRREVIERRRWESEQTFLDLIGLTALLPGPSSTEMAIELGRRRAGRPGLVVAGMSFILPAAAIVGTLAWLYERYGTTAAADDLRRGILPVVVVIVAQAVWKLGGAAFGGALTAVVAGAACGAFLAGVNELVIIAAGAILTYAAAHPSLMGGHGLFALPLAQAASAAGDTGLVQLFWSFLRIGATLFGSGYVIVAYVDAEFVDRLGVLTSQQLLDAVSIGQVTPGPLFTTATFVGFLTGGAVGAAVASVAIFLPAFLLVAALGGTLDRVIRHPATRAAFDGLNAAAVGLIAGVCIELAGDGISDALGVVLATAAALVLLSTRLNPTWLVGAGAVAGLAAGL
ncbi:MAG: chromate efflux transporter [Acidimicrobiia bacterium]